MKSPFFVSLLCIIFLNGPGTIPFLQAQEKVVAVVYDDSGSMGRGKGSRCNAVSYAIQVMTAFLTEQDALFVVKMSDVAHPIQVDLNNRQQSIEQMANWICNSNTPIKSVHSAIDILTKYEVDEKWLVIFTDGEFNTYTSEDNRLIERFIRDDNTKVILLNIDVPQATFAKSLAQLGVPDIFHSSSSGNEIVKNMERISATLMTLPESGMNPQLVNADSVILFSDFPLKRLIVLDQAIDNTIREITKASAGGKLLRKQLEFNARKDELSSRITHIVSNQPKGVIPAGKIKIHFRQQVNTANLQFLPQVALELKVELDGRFKSVKGNNYILCHYDNLTEIRAKILDTEGKTISPTLLRKAKLTLFLNGKPHEMNFRDNMYSYQFKPEGPVTISLSAHHEGYYYFKSNLYSLSIEKCPEYTLPETIDYPPYKVTESELTSGINLVPLVDGMPAGEKIQGLYLKIIPEGETSLTVNEEKEGWRLKNTPVKRPMFAKTGKTRVTVELWSELQNRKLDSGQVQIEIQNIPFFERYYKLILGILAFLAALWYLAGLLKKPRFSRKHCIFYADKTGYGNKWDNDTYFFTGNFFNRWLVPYIPEQKLVNGILFKASGRRNSVIISKNSLNNLSEDEKIYLNGLEIAKGMTRDKPLTEKNPLEKKDKSGNLGLYFYIKRTERNYFYTKYS